MTYYDSQGNLVEFNGIPTSLEGANGRIFKLNDEIAYKKYFSYSENKIKQAIFEFLKSINSPHLVRLLERYYLAEDILNYEIFLDYANYVERDFSAYNQDFMKIDLYTYEWIRSEYFDILEQSVDYLLDNINELLRLSDLLSMNYVAFSDMKAENTVCNKNSIVLIDPDMYYFINYQENRAHLMLENRRQIFKLMKSLCQRLTEYRNDSISRSVTELFESSIKEPRYGISLLSKKLSGCKMPLDYVTRKK